MNDAQGAIGSANNISMPCNQLLLHCIIFFTVKDQSNSFLTVGERLSAETLASQGLSFENLKKVVPQNNFFK
jgi:hypothetical protein